MRLPAFLHSRPVRILGILAILGGVTVAGVFAFHRWQLGRTAARLLAEARDAFQQRDYKAAAPLYEQYVALRPGDIDAKADQARILDAMQTNAKSRNRLFFLLSDVLRQKPGETGLRRRLVEVAFDVGRTSDALEHLNELRAAGVDDGWLWFQTARIQDAQARYSEAAASCREALDRNPKLLDAAELLARLDETRLDRKEDADQLLDRLVADNPASAKAYLIRGRHRLARHEAKKALADLNHATQLDPDNRETLLIAGRAALDLLRSGLGAREKETLAAGARSRLGHAIEANPKDAEIPLLLADIEDAAGHTEAAVRWLREGLDHQPENVVLQARLVELLIKEGEFASADAVFATIPENPTTLPLKEFLAGRRALGDAKWTDARRILESAVRDAAPYPELADHITLHLAECYRQQHQTDLEAAAYRRVLRSNPASETARLGLADIAAREGRWADAIAGYRPLLQLPGVPARLARALLRRNDPLPEEARDWKEFDAIVSQLNREPETALSALELKSEAVRLRGGNAEPQTAATNPPAALEKPASSKPIEPVPHPASSQAGLDMSHLVQRGDLQDALVLWQKTLRGSKKPDQLAITAAFARALLDRRDPVAAQEPVEWLQRHDPASLRTTQLAAWRLLQLNRCDEAARTVEAAANAANTERNRSAALLALTWHLLDEQTARLAPGPSGRERTTSDVPTQSVPDQHPTTPSVPCLALQRLGDRLVRKHLTEEPERLLMLTTFLALEEQPPQRFNTGEHAWSELRAAIVDEPSLILRWTPRLSSNAIQRLEAVAAAVISSSPAPTTLAVSLADFEALLGRYQVAEKWYRHVLKTEPKHVQTLNNLAWMLGLREKSLDEAQALIDRAIKVAGNEPRLLDTRGVVALARKENDKALRDLENSLRHQPGPVTALHLARARLQKGDQAGAKEALRLILADGMTEAHFHPLERPTFEALRRALNE